MRISKFFFDTYTTFSKKNKTMKQVFILAVVFTALLTSCVQPIKNAETATTADSTIVVDSVPVVIVADTLK